MYISVHARMDSLYNWPHRRGGLTRQYKRLVQQREPAPVPSESAKPATERETRIGDLWLRANREIDRSERIKLCHRVQEVIAENIPLVLYDARLTAARNVFGNVTHALYGFTDIRYLYQTDF